MGRGDGTRDVASLHVASMAARKLGRAALRRGLDDIASRDADIGAALARLGYPAPRQSDGGFAALLRIMVSQQLSTRSAAAIWGRLAAAAGPEVTPHSVLALDDAALRGAGLSGRKMEYGRGLAEAVDCGALDLDGLAKLSDEEGIAAISALRGFGRWSAEIYLLFALDRADIWPADDFAVRAEAGHGLWQLVQPLPVTDHTVPYLWPAKGRAGKADGAPCHAPKAGLT